MTPEKQRIAIAEACGWKWVNHPDTIKTASTFNLKGKWVLDPHSVIEFPHKIPDYPNDLNAMHEAEKVLTPYQQGSYALRWLPCVLAIDGREHRSKVGEFLFATPTAAQRAEAFLRTLNLWTE